VPASVSKWTDFNSLPLAATNSIESAWLPRLAFDWPAADTTSESREPQNRRVHSP